MKNFIDKNIADNNLTLISSLWIKATVIIILCTSLASIASQFIWGARIGFIIAILWFIYKCKKESLQLKILSYKQGGWMIWTIVIGCFISLIVQPHCFLDSYSYRIPQMMFWIQEGHPWSVPNVDMRINQMPHVWPMLSASFYSFFGEKGIALPNFISLLLFIWLLRDSAKNANIKESLINYVVAIFISAPVVVMGASTNDNVLTCTTFLFLSYFFACRTETSPQNISLSAISFALACGIKPQYLTLAPLWIGWFFLYESKPYKQLKFIHYAILIPLAVICSPIPTMAINQILWGNFNSPIVIDSTSTTKLSHKVDNGRSFGKSLIILLKNLIDIPINPFFEQINLILTRYKLNNYSFRPLVLTEGASLGLFAFIPFLLGIFKKKNSQRKEYMLPLFTFIALLLATYVTEAQTLGRSFIGFFWLILPFVFLGLSQYSKKTITFFAVFSFIAGFVCIILDPSAPLWPAKFVANNISDKKIKKQLLDYAHYSKRQYAITDILKLIPNNETNIGIIINADNPIGELWFSEKKIKVIPLGTNVTFQHLKEQKINYIIIKHPILKTENASNFIENLKIYEVAKVEYITHIQRGLQSWFLYKVKE